MRNRKQTFPVLMPAVHYGIIDILFAMHNELLMNEFFFNRLLVTKKQKKLVVTVDQF